MSLVVSLDENPLVGCSMDWTCHGEMTRGVSRPSSWQLLRHYVLERHQNLNMLQGMVLAIVSSVQTLHPRV